MHSLPSPCAMDIRLSFLTGSPRIVKINLLALKCQDQFTCSQTYNPLRHHSEHNLVLSLVKQRNSLFIASTATLVGDEKNWIMGLVCTACHLLNRGIMMAMIGPGIPGAFSDANQRQQPQFDNRYPPPGKRPLNISPRN